LLQQADLLVIDELSDPAISALAPAGCEVCVVGKRGGKAYSKPEESISNTKSVPQTAINSILLTGAAAGKRVVRMKGGDPLVYGRVQQEMAALRGANVPFELVPGVTSVRNPQCETASSRT
jgi:siroheme synthase